MITYDKQSGRPVEEPGPEAGGNNGGDNQPDPETGGNIGRDSQPIPSLGENDQSGGGSGPKDTDKSTPPKDVNESKTNKDGNNTSSPRLIFKLGSDTYILNDKT